MVVWAVLKNGPTPGLVERTGMPTTRREPAAVPVDRAQAHGARRADAGRPNARDMAAGHGDVPGAWRRLRLGFLVADPHQEPGRHEPGIDWRHRFGGERGRRRGAIVAGRRSDRCMNRHWYFWRSPSRRRGPDELRACWRTLRAFDDGHRGHRPEPELVLAGGRFVPSMISWPEPEPERRLAAGGRSDGLSPRQIAPAGIAFISSIGILGGAVFPAVFGFEVRTGTQYRETT